MTTTPTKYKYRLEHKGTVVAESDWSNILFDYTRRRPEKAPNYTVYNNVTGQVAGTPSVKATVKKAAPKKRVAVKR